ncbi:hypothetical protein TKK_0009893 [Trichogramma kaykai]
MPRLRVPVNQLHRLCNTALLYFVNNQESLSKIDFEQQWGKPSAQQFAKDKYSKGRSFEEMYPPPDSNVNKRKADNECDKIEPYLIELYKRNIVIDEKDVIEFCCSTTDQSSNHLWYLARKVRFSASSNVHSIKIQSSKSTEDLIKDMLEPKTLNTVSMRYGTRHEGTARKEYEIT